MRALVAVLGVLALVAVACDNEESGNGGGGGGGEPTGSRQGVTDSEIRVGALVSITNPLGLPYEQTIDGARAYFDKVNADGGVFDREIVIAAERDDGATRNLQEARALVEEDQVFAIVPVVAQFFTGAEYLAEQGTPTFGWNINAEWSEGPNLFGEKGSYLCFTCPAIPGPFIAKSIGARSAAIFAYGAVPQSNDCADGLEAGFEKFGVDVGVKDTSLSFGFTDTSAAIDAVRDANVDFVATCMEITGNAKLASDMRAAGLEISAWAPQGYDPQNLEELGSQLENFYFQTVFWPFEVPDPPEGMQDYLDAMEERNLVPSELSLAGWINANLLVEGITEAGEDFTQESVVEAINSMEEPFTANGILAPTQIWASTDDYPEGAHGPALNGTSCQAFVVVQDGEFEPVFGEPGRPFVCFEGNNAVDGTGVPSIDDPIFLPE